jgi:ABC-2 type transport system permease protein
MNPKPSVIAYRELIKNLVLKDLKLKYRDSVLGFLWSLANPLLLILVYSFVFQHILRAGTPNFPFFILVGILPWNFFSQSLMMSTGSILDNGALIRKVAVPMEVFPLATVLFNLAQYLLALTIFFPAVIFLFGVSIGWSWIAFFPVLALQVLFTLGFSFLLSAATVFYRDIRHFTEVLLTLLFWLTPIVYDLETVPQSLKAVLYANPLTYFILAYQDILYRGEFVALDRLLAVIAFTLLSLVCGYFLFAACRIRFAEEV